MREQIKNSFRGLTLTELIIASIMVTIVLLGIGAADYAIRRMERDFSREASLYSQLAAAAERIRYEAREITGDATPGSLGVALADNRMCFRQDRRIDGVLRDTPADYTDDTWACFSVSGNDLFACRRAAAGNCPADAEKIGTVAGTIFNNASQPLYAVFEQDTATGRYYFQFRLVTRRDNSEGVLLSGTTITRGTTDNPQEQIEYRMFPEMHSF
ncbi:MAG: hypothetical protein GX606_04170 [Elusimicrobia bacterium]|nr:hypothetical protein [Elusimicrobiota bacterium]